MSRQPLFVSNASPPPPAAQLETVTIERDDLKARLDAVKNAAGTPAKEGAAEEL